MLQSQSNQPPRAEQKPHAMEIHGDTRIDKYFWMKDRDSKPVLDYLKAENDYVEKVMAPEKALRETLYKELRGRIKEDDNSPPFKKGKYWYYVRFEQGKEYPIVCRKKGDLAQTEEILLNVNEMAKGHEFYSLSAWEISPDEKTIAFAVDQVGRRFYDVFFKDIQTGKLSEAKILQVSANFEWANDNDHLFYVKKNPETLREESVVRFALSTQKHEEVFFEKDDTFSVGVSRSLTDRWIYIVSEATDSTEWRILNADKPRDDFKVALAREEKHEYSLHDGGDAFYIRSNWKAPNFKIMKVKHDSVGNKDTWSELIPHSTESYIEGLNVFKDFINIEERFKGLTRIRLLDRKSQKQEWIQFPDEVYVVGIATNEVYAADRLRFDYQSPVTPASVYDYVYATKKSLLIKAQEVPTYDSKLYVTHRRWAKGHDGVQIPISIVHRKDTPLDGTAPALVYGYGSYGLSIDPGFRASVVSLLDRGFIYAIAHVRGGQELGRQWFETGRLMNKRNSFLDFISVTDFLVKEKWTHPKKVFAEGGSAGGLLMGGIANMRPDLFRGLLIGVPFVDALTTMLDASIPLTTVEYSQWGNPNEKPAYDYIKSYSPYDNIEKKNYPAMIVITGYHDSQVQYWEPAKYVAKLRELKTDSNLILFRTEMEAGHGGASGRFKRLEEQALEFSFVLKVLQQN